jgi:hypothetical protein
MLGIVSKNPIDHDAIAESPAPFAEHRDIGPARAYIQGFVDSQPRPIERQQNGQARACSHREGKATVRKAPS